MKTKKPNLPINTPNLPMVIATRFGDGPIKVKSIPKNAANIKLSKSDKANLKSLNGKKETNSHYYFHPDISYKTFKAVNDKLYKGTGPDIKPRGIDKILWELLRDRKINILVDTKSDDPVHFSLKEIPKGSKIISDYQPL